MKKTLTTIILLLLVTYSASAQIYRAGGIQGFGTTTGYGSRSGGGGPSGQSGPKSWFGSIGGIYNTLSSDDIDNFNRFGGIGGVIEVGKGSNSIGIEYSTLSFDELEDTPSNVELTQVRAYLKKRKYFLNFFYVYGSTGIINYNIKFEDTDFDESEFNFLMNFGLGLDVNFGGFGIYLESGLSTIGLNSVSVGNTTVATNPYGSSTIQLDGVRGGLKFLF